MNKVKFYLEKYFAIIECYVITRKEAIKHTYVCSINKNGQEYDIYEDDYEDKYYCVLQ